MGAFTRSLRVFAIMMIGELMLLMAYFVITGTFSDGPLQAIVDICNSTGTTPVDIATAVFIIGSILNVAVAIPLYVIFGRD